MIHSIEHLIPYIAYYNHKNVLFSPYNKFKLYSKIIEFTCPEPYLICHYDGFNLINT